MTLSLTLRTVQTLAGNIETATGIFERSLRPTLQEYIDFLPERGTGWTPSKYTSASDYSFREIEGSSFVFQSEEFYEYGEYTQDVVELPFDFIDAPEAYKTGIRDSMAAAAKKRTERNREAAQDRVNNLKRQLEVAERSLEKTDK